MKKLFLLLTFSISLLGFSQVKLDSLATVQTPEKKLKFGLGTGFNFVGGTSISLSPHLTYKVSDKVSLGGGLQFNYNGIKNLQNTTTFGANALAFYTPLEKLLTTLEFAELNVTRKNLQTNLKENFWDSALFAGVGYQITPKISAGAKYNLLYNKDKSVYSSPLVPFVNIGF